MHRPHGKAHVREGGEALDDRVPRAFALLVDPRQRLYVGLGALRIGLLRDRGPAIRAVVRLLGLKPASRAFHVPSSFRHATFLAHRKRRRCTTNGSVDQSGPRCPSFARRMRRTDSSMRSQPNRPSPSAAFSASSASSTSGGISSTSHPASSASTTASPALQ